MARMGRIALTVITELMDLEEELVEDEEGASGMVSLVTVAAMLADWTDPRKLVDVRKVGGFDGDTAESNKKVDCEIHLNLAIELLESLLHHGCSSKSRSRSRTDEAMADRPCRRAKEDLCINAYKVVRHRTCTS